MSKQAHVQSACDILRVHYSSCDISDALLKLNVPAAGYLTDALPLRQNSTKRLVAPISTVQFVPKHEGEPSCQRLPECNIPHGSNWTDMPAPGTVVLAVQPEEQSRCALLGDIMATRLSIRGVKGVVASGRVRDVQSCVAIAEKNDFPMWSKGVSAASPTLHLKPWSVDVPVQIEELYVEPGDILCADEGDQAVVIIPQRLLAQVLEALPILKLASDQVLEDVRGGMTLPMAVKRHPDFYSNYSTPS